MLRLFVAIRFPADIRDRLAGLMGGAPGARWVAPEDLHLTLRFVGEVDEGAAADLDAALCMVETPAFPLTLDGVGVFGSERRARVLWAGVTASPELAILQGRVEAAARRAGLPAETRKFIPHVTLARLDRDAGRDRIGRFIEQRGLFRAGPFMVNGFSLMRSHLGHRGAAYEELREYIKIHF